MSDGKFKLDPNYNDVASRLADLREKHPDASMQPLHLDRPFWFETLGDQTFLVYAAACYRSEDDSRPGVGIAWEPFPGRTPYTKDSEVMVAETSAWGRAIVAALAADTKKGIASGDEIAARQQEPPATDERRQAAQEAIAALSDSERETVAMWMRNHKIPSLKRAGVTLTQLNELTDFIEGLDRDPFLENNPADRSESGGVDASSGAVEAADNSGDGAPHSANRTSPANPATVVKDSLKGLAGSERKAVRSSERSG